MRIRLGESFVLLALAGWAVSGCGAGSEERAARGILTPSLLPPYAVAAGPQASSLALHTWAADGGDYDPAPSPDGTWLVFASTRNSREPQLYRQGISAAVVTQLTSPPGEYIQPAVSPDGTEVAFAGRDAGSWDIWIMPSSGGARENLTSTPGLDEIHPTWHPSGKALAFNAYRPQDGEWWICARSRGSSTVSWIAPGLAPSWSPRGDRIAFQRARRRGGREYALWSVDVRAEEGGLFSGGAESQILSSPSFSAVEPAFSPDGERLVFVAIEHGSRQSESCDLWSVRIDGTDLVRLTNTPEPEYGPAWSGIGREGETGRVFFTSERDGRVNIWSLAPELAPARRVQEGRGPAS